MRAFYRGESCCQHSGAIPAFREFFKIFDCDLLIEVGTGKGVFSSFLFLEKSDKTKFVTYDFTDTRTKLAKSLNFDFRIRDIFLEESQQEIKSLISQSNSCVFLCDNGNKVQEVKIYSDIIRSGDIIMAHDYYPEKDKFLKESKYLEENINTGWKGLEIWDARIKTAIEKNKLKHFMPELFHKVAWGCFIKC